MAESQLSELRNMRVLLEEARVLARNLAYHRRARLEEGIGQVLDEIDRQIEELQTNQSSTFSSRHSRERSLYELASPFGISPETSSLDTSREASPKASL